MKRLIVAFILVVAFMFSLSTNTVLAQVDYCEGDFDNDGDQDGSDASLFKSDFGRSLLKNPCPPKTFSTSTYNRTNYILLSK